MSQPKTSHKKAFRRLVVFSAAAWTVTALAGAALVVRSGDSIAAYLAPIGSELGGWFGLLLGSAAPGGEPIPTYEISIAPQALRAADLFSPGPHDAARARPTEPSWVPARLHAGEAEYGVDLQLRDVASAADGSARAWRVRFREKAVSPIREIEFTPADETAHATELTARDTARELGLIAPPGGFARLVVNGVEAGTFFWTERISRAMFERLGFPDGEALMPVRHSRRAPAGLAGPEGEALALAHYAPMRGRSSGDVPMRKLNRLLDVTRQATDGDFATEIPQILNVEQYLTWNALSWLFGSPDSEAFPELTWYLDPVSGLLEPIVEGLGDEAQRTDAARFDAEDASRLTARLLAVPQYRQRRNEILWTLVADPDHEVVDTAEERLGGLLVRLARAPGALSRLHDYAEFRRQSRTTLHENAISFRESLATSRVETTPSRSVTRGTPTLTLDVAPHGPAEIEVTEIRFELDALEVGPVRDAAMVMWDPRGREIRRAAVTPEVIGSSVVLRPEHFSVWRPEAEDDANGSWKLEVRLPFFAARAWRHPDSLERIDVAYRNTVTGRALPTTHLLSPHEGGREAESYRALFRPVEDVIARSGIPFERRGDDLVVPAGTHVLASTLVLPPDVALHLEPGVQLRLGPGVSLFSFRPLVAEGTSERPISITALDPEKPWGAIGIARAGTPSRLSHITVSGGSDASFDGIEFSGQLSFNSSPVVIRDSEIREGREDGLSLKRSEFEVEGVRFVENHSDGLDVGWAQGVLRDATFLDNGDDGLDLGTSTVTVERSSFRGMADKAISAGERSDLAVTESLIAESRVGIASKEDSRVDVARSEFRRNEVGLALYRDKAIFGGGAATVTDGIFARNRRDFDVEPGSDLELHGVQRQRAYGTAAMISFLLSPLSTGGAH